MPASLCCVGRLLARREAVEAAQLARQSVDILQAEFQVREARLQDDLAAERAARIEAERTSRVALEAALHEAARARAPAERQSQGAIDAYMMPRPYETPMAQHQHLPEARPKECTKLAWLGSRMSRYRSSGGQDVGEAMRPD